MCRNKMSNHSCVPSLTTESNISIRLSNRKTKIASVYLILHPQTLFATLHESITSAPMPAASLNSAYAHQVSTHMGIAYSSTLLFAMLSFVIRKLDNTSIRVFFTKKQLRSNMENHYLHRFLWHVITRVHSLTSKPGTVYPKKYAHDFVVLCFVVVMQSFIMNSHEVFIHIHQGCFAGTGAIVKLPVPVK